jgi:hypothetical protein
MKCIALPLVCVGIQGTLLYSFEHDCVLAPEFHAIAQGLPGSLIEELMPYATTATKPREIVGDAFCAPVLGLAITAYLFNPMAPWWKS